MCVRTPGAYSRDTDCKILAGSLYLSFELTCALTTPCIKVPLWVGAIEWVCVTFDTDADERNNLGATS